jgi:hypothetical protein
VRRIRRERKVSTPESVRDASFRPTTPQKRRVPSIRPTTPHKRRMPVDQSRSQSASTPASTNAQSQITEECEVCADTITPELILTQEITQDCTHPSQVAICKTCVEHHIRVQIDSVGWDGIRCPVQECHGIFKYNDMKNMAATADFERYDAHILQRAMNKEGSNDDYRQCAHPNCTGGGFCDLETESFMICPACAQQTCIECNTVWHSGKTCEKHKEELRIQKENKDVEVAAAHAAAEAKSAKYIEANSKACPNKNCGYRIQKTGGCDHMTCRKCRHEFCRICDASYREIRRIGNAAHREDCTYHSDQLSRAGRQRPSAPRATMPLPRRRAVGNTVNGRPVYEWNERAAMWLPYPSAN